MYWDDERDCDCLKLDVEFYDWDGQRSGFRGIEFRTLEFEDEKPLGKLRFVPFKLLKRPEQVRVQLVERGKIFEKMQGYHFKHYSGMKMVKTPEGCLKTGQVWLP